MKQNSGAEAEFNGIVTRYYEKIRKYCAYAMNGNLNAAEDCAQDVFIVLYQSMDKLRDYDKIGGWLYKTASNITRQYAAALGRDRKRTISIDSFFEENKICPALPAALTAPENGEGNEEARIIEENAVSAAQTEIERRLKPEDVRILRLAFKEKRPLKEVAALLDISLSAAKSRASRLRQKISALAHTLLADYDATFC